VRGIVISNYDYYLRLNNDKWAIQIARERYAIPTGSGVIPFSEIGMAYLNAGVPRLKAVARLCSNQSVNPQIQQIQIQTIIISPSSALHILLMLSPFLIQPCYQFENVFHHKILNQHILLLSS
jgi:hypothetical protein